LERWDRRLLPGPLRVDLIDGDAVDDLRARSLLGMRGRKEYSARSEMVGADFGGFEGFGLTRIGAADDRDAVAKGRQRFERVGEFEIAAALARAGIMESSRGKARLAPAPRRSVRRDRASRPGTSAGHRMNSDFDGVVHPQEQRAGIFQAPFDIGNFEGSGGGVLTVRGLHLQGDGKFVFGPVDAEHAV